MADTYITVQGDTWDSIAYDLYGSEDYMQLLVEANWPLLDILVFSAGTELVVPDPPEEIDTDLPFWRIEDDDEDDEDDSDVETDEDVEADDDDDEDYEEDDIAYDDGTGDESEDDEG